ncbi:MAG: hypothetical protein H7239_10915 [Flavobacterium sp.]|nr:hypothetical protein [Flavobacterium sp.]
MPLVLVISISNYFRIAGNESIKKVGFISILAIGMILGLLLREIISVLKNR